MSDQGIAIAPKKLSLSYYITHVAPKSASREVRSALKQYKKMLGGRREATYLRDLDGAKSARCHEKAHTIRILSEVLRCAFAGRSNVVYAEPHDSDPIGQDTGCYQKRTHMNHA